MFTNITLMRFLQLIRLRSLREKISCFPLSVQISAILFQFDCAMNQFVISISSLAKYWGSWNYVNAEGIGK